MRRLKLLLLGFPLMLLPPAALLRYLWCVFFNPDKSMGIARSFDRVLNVATNGDERETVSSRAARARDAQRRWGCVLCKWLDQLDPNHCTNSIGK